MTTDESQSHLGRTNGHRSEKSPATAAAFEVWSYGASIRAL